MSKPLCIDLFCGLGGWSQAFIDAGYRAVGFDIERHDYGKGGYPGELVLRDVRSINGAALVKEYGVPAVIVCSPPCQEYSYMAMPWSKAKAKLAKIKADPAEQKRLTDLFNQCFRIQREISEASGHYVPLIIENVRGAQPWVGKAKWNFGSFYLWGDVPALMPIPAKGALKLPGNNSPDRWEDREIKRLSGGGADSLMRGKQAAEGEKVPNHVNRRDGYSHTRHLTNRAEHEGVKQGGISGLRDNGKGDRWFQDGAARSGSKSSKRKEASAEIAKIPPALASWIARCFKPA